MPWDFPEHIDVNWDVDKYMNSLVPDPDKLVRQAETAAIGAQPRQAKYQPLEPSMARQFADKLLGVGGSALGFIGGTLDKFGPRQMRAVLSGHLEDIPLSLIPFGGSLGIDDQSHNLSTDEILTGHGRWIPKIIPENDPTRWELRDFIAPAIDIAMMPPILPGVGSLTAAGKAASKIEGALPRTLAQRVAGYTGTEEGIKLATESPRMFTRTGRAVAEGSVPEDILANVANAPRTLEGYAAHPINQWVAPKTFTDAVPGYQAGDPLASLVSARLPWWAGHKEIQAGSGGWGTPVAQAMSDAADAWRYSPTIGNTPVPNPVPMVRNLFQAAPGRALHPEAQYSNEYAALPAREEVLRQARAREIQMRTDLERTMQETGTTGMEKHAWGYMRDVAEQVPVADDPASWWARRITPYEQTTPEQGTQFAAAAPRFAALGGQIRNQMEAVAMQAKQYGLPHQDLVDEYANYLFRRTPAGQNQSYGQMLMGKLWQAVGGSQISRHDSLRDIPGATNTIQRLSVDPQVSGPNALLAKKEAIPYLLQQVMPYAMDTFRQQAAPGDVLAEVMKLPPVQQLAILSKMSPELADVVKSSATTQQVIEQIAQGVTPQNLQAIVAALPRSTLASKHWADLLAAPDAQNIGAFLGSRSPFAAAQPNLSPWTLRTWQQVASRAGMPDLAKQMESTGGSLDQILEIAGQGGIAGEVMKHLPPGVAQQIMMAQRGEALTSKMGELAGVLGNLGSRHAADQVPLFDLDPISAMTRRTEQYAKAFGSNRALLDVIARHAKPAADFDVGPGQLPLREQAMPVGTLGQAAEMARHNTWRPPDVGTAGLAAHHGIVAPEDWTKLRDLMDHAAWGDPLAAAELAKYPEELQTAAHATQVTGFPVEATKALRLRSGLVDLGEEAGGEQLLSGQDVLDRLAGGEDLTGKFLKNFHVSRGLTDEILAQRAGYMAPHELAPAGNAWDSMTNLYKSLLYPVWAASQVRNWVGGTVNNWLTGAADPRYTGYGPKDWFGARRYAQPQLDAMRLLRGEAVELPPRYAALGEQAGRDKLMSDLYSNRMAFQSGQFTEIGNDQVSLESGRLRRMLAADKGNTVGQDILAGHQRALAPYWDLLRGRAPEGGWDTIKPWAVQGWGDRTEDANTMIRESRHVGDVIENMLRGVQGMAFLRQGVEPGVVGDMVRKTHFDYRDLADAEKNVGRRLFPFYTFTRKNIPFQTEMLAGGMGDSTQMKLAQFIRGMELMKNQGITQDYTPQFLGGGFAVPLGAEADGKQRWMSETGIPTEEAFSKLKLDYSHGVPLPDLKGTLYSYLGMLNPMIKGPLEQMVAGRQFFSNRELIDLHPTGIGSLYGNLSQPNAQVFTQLLSNLPISRFVTSLDKLTDQRKGWLPKAINLGTGMRISDIDMTKSRGIDLRNALDQMMRVDPEIKSFMEFYVPPAEWGHITPQTMETMRYFTQLKKEARDRELAQRKLMPATQ